MREEDWELCKELARFLAALDDSGATLREALAMAEVTMPNDEQPDGSLAARLEVPMRNGGGSRSDSGESDGSSVASRADTVSPLSPGTPR